MKNFLYMYNVHVYMCTRVCTGVHVYMYTAESSILLNTFVAKQIVLVCLI